MTFSSIDRRSRHLLLLFLFDTFFFFAVTLFLFLLLLRPVCFDQPERQALGVIQSIVIIFVIDFSAASL